MKSYLRSIVRQDGKGRMGLGVEMFRLDAIDELETDLTTEEREVVDELGSEIKLPTTAIVRIYEDLGEDFWTGSGVTAKKFASELDELGDIKRLNIHINCLGGDAATGQAIHSIIADHPSRTTAYIDGVCASAATLVASGANEVIARHNTNYMIHHPWAVAVGNAETMKKAADDLAKITIPIVSVYKEQVKGKIDEEKIRSLMDNETWMTAEEALEYGFVDQVRGKIKAIAKVNKTQIFCSGRCMDIAKYQYKNVPNYPVLKSDVNVELVKPKERTKPMMTVEQLAKEHPDVHANIINSERTRLASLDAMNGPGLETIIAKAKVEGKHATDIAMECLTVANTQLAQANATNALKRDAVGANAVSAGDAPTGKVASEEDKKKAQAIKLLTAAQASLLATNKRLHTSASGNRNGE